MKPENFRFKIAPFSTIPPAGGLFLGAGHREALAALEWGLDEPTGFTLLSGEVGTGKTTLIDALMTTRREQIRIARIQDPRLSFEEMLADILAQFGAVTEGQSRSALTRALARAGETQRSVVIVDEAQGLSDSLLEDLRLLSNVASGSLKLILVGQPELSSRLAQPALRQLSQRIGARATLAALAPNEIVDYVACRINAAGSAIERVFAPRALDAVVKWSGGIPRQINILCHNAIILASLSDASAVLRSHVCEAAKELAGPKTGKGYRQPRSLTKFPRWLPFVGALAVTCILFAISILSIDQGVPVSKAGKAAPLLGSKLAAEKARSGVVPTKNSILIENPSTKSGSETAQAEAPLSAAHLSGVTPSASRNPGVKPSPRTANHPTSDEIVVEDGDSLSKIAPSASASAEVAALPVPAAETLRLINRGGPPASASGEVAATPDSAATLPDPGNSEMRDLLQRAQAAQSNPEKSGGSMASSPAPSVAVAWPDYRPEIPSRAPSASASAEVAALPVPAAETLPLINRGGPPTSVSGEVAGTPDSAAILPSASTRHVPARRAVFNIQIQAAMDQKNANQIVGQLQQLGYHPNFVSTSIGGHTWYKVEIGPYASQSEAAAAKAELRLKYNSAFDPPAPILGDDSPDLLLPFSPTPLRIGLSTELFGN